MKTWFELSLPPLPPSCPGREGVNSTQPQEKFKNLDSGSTIWATILSVMLLGMGNFENQLNFIISRFCLCRAPLFGPHFLCHAARDGRHWKQTEFYYFQVLSLQGSTIFSVTAGVHYLGHHFLCHTAKDGRHWKHTEFYYFQVLSLPGSIIWATIFFVMLLGMDDIEKTN